MGYIVLAVSLNTAQGLFAALFHPIIYILNSIGISSVLLLLLYYKFNNHSVMVVTYIMDFNYFIKVSPVLSYILIIILLSMAGVPPFAGFYAKWFISVALLDANAYFLCVIVILMSVVSVVYHIR